MPTRPRRTAVTRRERLRRAAAILGGIAVVAALAGWTVYRATRPEVRRPGEALPEITEKLSKNLPPEAPEPRFTDVTEAAGLDGFVSFTGPRTSQLPEDMGAGLAWGDYDADGDDDLFLVGAGGALNRPEAWAPSRLYENLAAQGQASFREAADFPETRIAGMAAAWGDYDADGWLDLVVTGYRSLLLFHNDQGRLVRDESFTAPDGYWAGASWADFDNDHDLDLYVCGYVKYVEDTGGERSVTEQYGSAVPYTLNPASFEPERNLLFQNDGDGAFTEVALFYGVSNPEGRSLSALWHDFDADGRLDLYVANDISDNALYLNRGESFEDAGLEAWVADYRGAMGLAAGDWDRDGDDDLFVTHWIAQENALYDSRLEDLRRAAAPGDSAAPPVRLSFSDVAARVGLGQTALHMVGWGTEFADLDADGWLDLVVANGSTLENDATPRGLEPQPAMLLWNQHGEHYHDLAPLADGFATKRIHRGLAIADYDRDGDPDVAIAHLDGGVRLLRNDMEQGNWLKLRLRSRNGFGEGATLVAWTGDLALRRSVTGASYLSQSSRTVHFGLGPAERVDRLEVRWLGGEPQSFGGLEANAFWELSEGDSLPRRIDTEAAAGSPPAAAAEDPRRVLEFWSKQRAAMDAMKKDGDVERALELFREALALNPEHGDSRYYLANCLAILGRTDEALAELDRLRRNESNQRAHKQYGVLRALTATSRAELDAAQEALERAHEINSEETGTLLVLGEIALIEGDEELAEQRFEWVCQTNPKAVGAFFLRGYLAWKRGDLEAAADFLESARAARGEDWKPEGAVAEGDVASRMHREQTPLSRFWESWDDTSDLAAAFGPLDSHRRSREWQAR